MDDKLTTTSTSSDSSKFYPYNFIKRFFYLVLSEYSLSDLIANNSVVPSSSTMPVLPPFRSSFTLADMKNITNSDEHQSFFLDDFNSDRSSAINRW
jgi:hypothetical protein